MTISTHLAHQRDEEAIFLTKDKNNRAQCVHGLLAYRRHLQNSDNGMNDARGKLGEINAIR